MIFLIAQIQIPRFEYNELIRGLAMLPGFKVVQQIFQRGIALIKIFQTNHHG